MTAPHGIVRVLRHGTALTFRVEGWGTLAHSLPVRQFAEHALASGVAELRVDLRKCTYMDSTFLGTLLFLKRSVDRRGHGQLVLVCPSDECRQILEQLGIDKACPVITEEMPAEGDWTELAIEPDDLYAFRCNVVEAHQELAGCGGPAGAAFGAVAHGLAESMKEADKPR
jgi:anti-anti-sigma factor